MNLMDLLAAAAAAFGFWRGRSRGLPAEAHGLLRSVMLFVAGAGLTHVLARLIRLALAVSGAASGVAAFGLSLALAWWLTRRWKRWLTVFLAARYAGLHRIGGAIAGATRALLLVVMLEGLLQLAGKPERTPGSRFSAVGRLAALTIARH